MAKSWRIKSWASGPAWAAQVVLGEPTLQQVNGELLWAVPTYHSGLFKWLTNMSGTPGYVTVSATNPQDVGTWMGTALNTSRARICGRTLLFYARFTAAPFTGLTDYSFELDDTGRLCGHYHLPVSAGILAFEGDRRGGADYATGESENICH